MSDAAPRPDASRRTDTARRPRRPQAAATRRMRFRVGALTALAVVVGLILWLALRDTGGSPSSSPPPPNAAAVTPRELKTLATKLGHPIYWVGPKRGYTYELSQSPNGALYLRYLPHGVGVGAKEPYLSVATYPFPGAYGAIRSVLRGKGTTAMKVRGGGLGEISTTYPQSVHLAYPGIDYQIEVYDPTAGIAAALVASGKVRAIGAVRRAGAATAMSPAGLRALAKALGHAVYWVGPRGGYTYEVTQGSAGQVYLRYLPPDVAVGSSQAYLTIGSYPYKGAFEAIRALAQQKAGPVIHLKGGGLAIADSKRPTSIHLAYPGTDVQVEVFDPSGTEARKLVSSNQVRPVE